LPVSDIVYRAGTVTAIVSGDFGRLVDPDPSCTHAHLHTHHPPGYVQCAVWADEMLRKHRQELCPGSCGKHHIWVKKTPRKRAAKK
jgi:hypothetical protein